MSLGFTEHLGTKYFKPANRENRLARADHQPAGRRQRRRGAWSSSQPTDRIRKPDYRRLFRLCHLKALGALMLTKPNERLGCLSSLCVLSACVGAAIHACRHFILSASSVLGCDSLGPALPACVNCADAPIRKHNGVKPPNGHLWRPIRKDGQHHLWLTLPSLHQAPDELGAGRGGSTRVWQPADASLWFGRPNTKPALGAGAPNPYRHPLRMGPKLAWVSSICVGPAR